MLSNKRQILARRKALQPQNIHPIRRSDLIIVRGVCKRKREHTLLLQVCLVDTRERADDDGEAT
jgi:hypothetical protein